MIRLHSHVIPADSAFAKVREIQGAYADCYAIQVKGRGSLDDYINVFFDTWLFRLEILVLGLFSAPQITDVSRKSFANGTSDQLGLWHVQTRTQDELILNVGDGPIRTWLRIQPASDDPSETILIFGSAVLPMRKNQDGEPRLDLLTRAFIPFHKAYSILLLRAAARKWAAQV